MGCSTSRGAQVVDPAKKPEERPSSAKSSSEDSTPDNTEPTVVEAAKHDVEEESSWPDIRCPGGLGFPASLRLGVNVFASEAVQGFMLKAAY